MYPMDVTPGAQRLLVVAAISLLCLAPRASAAQNRDEDDERDHFQLKIGANYEQGDFGTRHKTKTLIAPVTLKYLGESFEIGLTTSYTRLDSVGGVSIVGGRPVPTSGETPGRTTQDGPGDTYLEGRYYLIDDPGPGSPLPAFTPFAVLKIPTADEKRNLGTGEFDYGFGLEVEKQLAAFFVFGEVSYTVIGSPPRQRFRDEPGATAGVGRNVSDKVSVSAFVDWRRAIVPGIDDAVDVGGMLTYRLTRAVRLSPNFFVGLTNGSPDFAVGFDVAWNFGRW